MSSADRKLEGLDAYERLGRIGEGTYGVVYKARNLNTGEFVALKKIRSNGEKEFPLTSIREIKILKRIRHPNIVQIKEVVSSDKLKSAYIVFEYCEHDLAALLDQMKRRFTVAEVKCITLQILEGLAHLHSNFILHRDLKLSNMLMNNDGRIVLADFGLARLFSHPLDMYTPKVVTLWYRAPELLLGSDKYHAAVDMWALGCILGELLMHKPLFPAKTELEQIRMIYELLGAPNERIWPGYNNLPDVKSFTFHDQYKYNELPAHFDFLSNAGIDLLKNLLAYDPAKRITAKQALNHPWFREKPLPKARNMMPTFPSEHGTHKRKQEKKISKYPHDEGFGAVFESQKTKRLKRD